MYLDIFKAKNMLYTQKVKHLGCLLIALCKLGSNLRSSRTVLLHKNLHAINYVNFTLKGVIRKNIVH